MHVRTSAAGMGQGVSQMATHMLCETVPVPPDRVVVEAPDTERTPGCRHVHGIPADRLHR